MENVFQFAMQAETLCNLNCSYCWLPNRSKSNKMRPEVAREVAAFIKRRDGYPVEIIWHLGEPLAAGIAHLELLFKEFEEVHAKGLMIHHIQTNATLITDAWCYFFQKHNVHVGVSIDGPKWATINRANWSGTEMYQKIMNGIECLKKHDIPFMAICVVGQQSIGRVRELYEFFRELGCVQVGFNFEDKIGINTDGSPYGAEAVRRFWEQLLALWYADKSFRIRDFKKALEWIVLDVKEHKDATVIDYFPSISPIGEVVVISPEFMGIKSEGYKDFVVGNVLESTLEDILTRASDTSYVKDFLSGVHKCQESCNYFDYCKGGAPAIKFFELGTVIGTETTACLYAERLLLDAVLSGLPSEVLET